MTTVEELLAKHEIYEVVARYCRGVDRLDRGLVRSCYHDDATDEHGSFSGTADEYVEWAFGLLGAYDSTTHLVANHLVDLGAPRPETGKPGEALAVAVSEAYGVALHETADGEPRGNLAVGFRFVDRFERRGGGPWLIARRVATTEWVRRLDPSSRWEVPPHLRRGQRDRTDVLYQLLADL